MIPPNFRKLPPSQRREILKQLLHLSEEEIQTLSNSLDLSSLADVLVETSIGTFPVPMGIATGFLIDRRTKLIPMATEEPSVIAAASYAARLVKTGGGFQTWANEPVMTTQIFIKECLQDCMAIIQHHEPQIKAKVNALIPRMVQRGGGFRGVSAHLHKETLAVSLDIDVRDAMGANAINTVAEGMKDYLQSLCGGRVLMGILTNASPKRMAGASFKIPEKHMRKGSLSGEEVCRRIIEANELASAFPERAVTHNKGVMNGITALTLATGNDTRAVESAAHYYAQINGHYRPLTDYQYENGELIGKISLPLALGTVGGTTGFWPASRLALKILDNPDSQTLNRIAAALGLAQNLAALFALVTEGIQGGHMKLHAARMAYKAGARGDSVRQIAETLWNEKRIDLDLAKELVERESNG